MNPPIYHDTIFPYVYLSLNHILPDTIDSIPQWIAQLKESNPHSRYQLDMDASHEQFLAIHSTILPYLEEDSKLAYVHITQSKKQHFLTPHKLQEIVMARNKKNRFTIQVNVDDRADYF